MYRRFELEGDIHASLECVPLVVRRKLDLAGLKISLAGWQALSREERLSLCHLPVDEPDDLAVYREVLRGFAARAGAPLPALDGPAMGPDTWCAPAVLAIVRERLGVALDADAVSALSEEERYALVKLADPKRDTRKLRLALGELGFAAAPEEQR